MRYPILVEEFGHFRCNHVPIIWDGNERNFLSGLRFSLGDRRRSFLGVWLWHGAHNN